MSVNTFSGITFVFAAAGAAAFGFADRILAGKRAGMQAALPPFAGAVIAGLCLTGHDGFPALLRLFFCLLLYAAAQTDMREGRLPDGFAAAAFLLGVLAIPAVPPSLPFRLLGAAAVSLPMFLISLLRPGAFGGGDIKLMAGCGFFLGLNAVLRAFSLAVLCGGGWALYLLLSGKAAGKDRFPFGPFLCAGMAAVMLF